MTQRDDNADDWAEYRRLVLSELERLNLAIEKLRDRCVEIQSYIRDEINSTKDTFSDRLRNHPNNEQFKNLIRDINSLDTEFSQYKKSQEQDSTISNRWGFWAAVVSIVGSLLVSIVSLAIALK